MIIDCISDLHGYYPKMDGGDLLIIAGDLTATDSHKENEYFVEWLDVQGYRKKIVIAGNHDNHIDSDLINSCRNTLYLCNSGTEFEGLKIWGTPHSLLFRGVNPKCTAFMGTEEELKEKYDIIPNDIDILISHAPPYGILDINDKGICCGSISLRNALHRIKCEYVICGHIHECGGREIDLIMTKVINASSVNEYYYPINKPVRIII